MTTKLQQGKMGLCRILRGCDPISFWYPCGLKSERSDFCEEWRDIPLKLKDMIVKNGKRILEISPKTHARIEKEFAKMCKRKYKEK